MIYVLINSTPPPTWAGGDQTNYCSILRRCHRVGWAADPYGLPGDDQGGIQQEIFRWRSRNGYSQQSHPRFRVTVRLHACKEEEEEEEEDAFYFGFSFIIIIIPHCGNAAVHALINTYRPRLRDQMQYCTDHPEEVSKLSRVKAQVDQVKSIMMENIDKVTTNLR